MTLFLVIATLSHTKLRTTMQEETDSSHSCAHQESHGKWQLGIRDRINVSRNIEVHKPDVSVPRKQRCAGSSIVSRFDWPLVFENTGSPVHTQVTLLSGKQREDATIVMAVRCGTDGQSLSQMERWSE